MQTIIHFIVNPIAGKGKNNLSLQELTNYFPKVAYNITVKKTEFALHATALTKASMTEGAQIIVACGGDGTINEVASCLINTTVVLGIIPMGSGNGLASNLKIPRNRNKALGLIGLQNTLAIDVGSVNGAPFFSNTGVGFDAHVISDYEENTTRQLFSYLKSTIKTLRSFDYKQVIRMTLNDRKEEISPFLLFISNSNEMGYKMSLTPQASLQDGLLDLIVVPRLSKIRLLFFALLFLFKKHLWMKEVRYEHIKRLEIASLSDMALKIQKDGEAYFTDEKVVYIAIHPKALWVCAPSI